MSDSSNRDTNEGATGTPPDVKAEILAGSGLALTQAAKRFPPYRAGRPLNPSTVFRWITDGVRAPGGRRIRLEGVRLGGRWLTSEQALARFIDAQTAAQITSTPPRPPTPQQRHRAAERAGEALERLGV
jgi:hypothetical protein